MNQRSSAQPVFFSLSTLISQIKQLGALLVVLVAFGVFSRASATPRLSRPNPLIMGVTQIQGAEGTGSCGGGYDLGVGLVDLDHGFAAGATTYDHGGFLWCETYAPFLWSEQDRTSILFKLKDEYNWEDSIYIPSGMTPDGAVVVGGVIFFDRGAISAPWVWTADGRPVRLLVLPNGYGGGNAVSVSSDGRLIAGNLRAPGRVGASQAAVWRDGSPQILLSTEPWSATGGNPFETNIAFTARRPHPMTDDGSVVVGAAGGAFLTGCKATKWVNGIEQRLSTRGIDAQSSVAVFVANSGVMVGYAVLSDGRVVLIRWDSAGNPQMFQPPNGLSVVNLSSIDSQGNAVGGALAQQFSCASCTNPGCKRKPFVWSRSNGFTILSENGLEASYDTSTVQDISDDGRVAVGQLSNCIVTPTSPPQLAFVWTAASGMVFVDELMVAYGQAAASYYSSTDVSRDGNRVLAVGNPPLIDAQSTPDLILDLAWPGATPKPTRTFGLTSDCISDSTRMKDRK